MKVKLLKTLVIDGSVEFAPGEVDVQPKDAALRLIEQGLAEAIPVSAETGTTDQPAEPEAPTAKKPRK